MKRLLIFLLFLTAPAQASALELDINSFGRPTVIQESWEQGRTDTPLPNKRVSVVIQDCPAMPGVTAGCADGDTIWINPAYDQLKYSAYIKKLFHHELAHVFDRNYLYPGDQRKIQVLLGYPASQGWDEKRESPAAPKEWFAEAAALCWLDNEFYQKFYGFPYGMRSDVLRVCRIMNTAYLRAETPPVKKTYSKALKSSFYIEFGSKTRVDSLSIKTGGQTYRPQYCFGAIRAKKLIRYTYCGRKLKINNSKGLPIFIRYTVSTRVY